MKQTELLIHARWIIPVVPDKEILEYHSIAVDEGRITALLPSSEARQSFEAQTTVDLGDHALIPGLVNAHTHTAMSLLRGIADDLPLMEWLEQHIWPAEQKWVSEQFVHDGTQLAIAEMLRSGTTCFNDMYFFPEVTSRVAASCFMRACTGMILLDFPTRYAENPDEYFAKGLAMRDETKHHPLINHAFAPHAPYSVSDEPLKKMQMLSDELDLPIHIHLHETAGEVEDSVKQTGLRPIARLAELGLLSPALTAVHMTQLEDSEIAQLAESGASVVHCPESNMKLASGFCPVHKLLDAGVNVALGTDGAASNNDLDMFGEMRSAALLGKAVASDASALPAHTVLRMATLSGAQALGLADQTGSLEVGKWADITAVDLGALESQPVYNPESQLVYAAGREQVSHVWVAGQLLMRERQLTHLDIEDLLQRTRGWQTRIAAGEPGH
ncbi:S-adenosylhomocysteine deaminase; Methylthioadenosine deaminase [hydrothermal vent metagenome]|uniref:S-adenosylhomocysteine deaminase Methylthioadenosine deaminase n=1 Tax=hydrothermal vent metagenome TaxID=652676 RepID=A0A3B0Z906_9ZZZZ